MAFYDMLSDLLKGHIVYGVHWCTSLNYHKLPYVSMYYLIHSIGKSIFFYNFNILLHIAVLCLHSNLLKKVVEDSVFSSRISK